MSYSSVTKPNLINLLELKDEDVCNLQERLNELKEQQMILLWLLFITASIGFMF